METFCLSRPTGLASRKPRGPRLGTVVFAKRSIIRLLDAELVRLQYQHIEDRQAFKVQRDRVAKLLGVGI